MCLEYEIHNKLGPIIKKERNLEAKRLKIEEHEDPEIQAEIRKGNTLNILYDSTR